MRRLPFAVLILALPVLPAEDRTTPGLNRFATKAYREIAPTPGNLIYSPFSISTALSMLLAGARGSTAKEIEATLGQTAGPSYHSDVSALIDRLVRESNTGGGQLSIANAMWPDRRVALEAAFRKTISTDYKAPLTLLDYSNPESCRSTINSWTEQQTKGKIRGLFAPGSIGASTRLVLTSAIYFKGSWDSPFETKATHPAPFHLGTSDVQADFMNKTADFGYAGMPDLQVLEMGYRGTNLAFDALLPRSGDLKGLENSLSPENLAKWFAALGSRKVEVALPKFRAESSFSLNDTLAKMGMRSAFSAAADLSGIGGQRNLYVSDVVHKAFVEVTETGTVAAAATGVAVALTALREERPPVVFRADHPFIFLIRDRQSGAILFAGRVMNPKS